MPPVPNVTNSRPGRLLSSAFEWFSRWANRVRPRPPSACPRCGHDLESMPHYREIRVCDNCGFNFPLPARARVRLLVDPGTFVELPPARVATRSARRFYTRPFYHAARAREAILTGTGSIDGSPVVLLIFDFRFYGGSMSIRVGEAIARAFEHATHQDLPLVAVIASGGVRIQEGTPALLQMAKTIVAVQEFQALHRPFIAVLTSPTTGGVYASFVSLADVLLAEPEAVIGFAGPRVAQAITGEKLPADSHRAEAALRNGMIDAIVARTELREKIARLLNLSTAPLVERGGLPPAQYEAGAGQQGDGIKRNAADVLSLARRSDRPSALAYIGYLFSDFLELHGDRVLGDDPAITGGFCLLGGRRVMVIAQSRTRGQPKERGAGPAGYRKAERLVHMAARLDMALITLIDTPGADPGVESERHGIGNAIAHCLAALLQVPVPTVSLILGEGTSGGALALAATDRVLMQENATYSVISPEGASAVLFGDSSHAAETVSTLRMTSEDLLPKGIVDRVIKEPGGGAQQNLEAAANEIKRELLASLVTLESLPRAERLAARRERYRHVGTRPLADDPKIE